MLKHLPFKKQKCSSHWSNIVVVFMCAYLVNMTISIIQGSNRLHSPLLATVAFWVRHVQYGQSSSQEDQLISLNEEKAVINRMLQVILNWFHRGGRSLSLATDQWCFVVINRRIRDSLSRSNGFQGKRQQVQLHPFHREQRCRSGLLWRW